MAGYYDIPSGARPYVRPSAPFPIDNLSILRFFFKFCMLLSGMSGMGLLMGKNPSIFNRVTAHVHTGKTVSGVLFLYYVSQ